MNESDELTTEIIAAAKRGDSDAFVAIYQALADPVYGYLLRNTSDPTWSADLTSDVFLEAMTAIKTFSGTPDGFRGWIFRIARNTMIDHFRRQSYRRYQPIDSPEVSSHLPAAPDDVEALALSHVEHEQLLKLVNELTAEQRDVVLLRLVAGLPVAEVAEILGKSAGAVKVMQHRALKVISDKARNFHDDL